MDKLFVFISGISMVAFWVGLVKPSLVGMPNRKRSSFFYLAICLVSSGVGTVFYPPTKSPEQILAEKERSDQAAKEAKSFKSATMTLSDYRSKAKNDRQSIVKNYLSSEDIPASSFSGFYSCLSEYTMTGAKDLQLKEVLGWCATEYKENPKSLDAKVNFDNFFENFSTWDGSYTPLVAVIKTGMHDEDSYKHISTSYNLQSLSNKPHAFVSTTFSGTNAYGAKVKNTVTADVDVKTGNLIKIVSNGQ